MSASASPVNTPPLRFAAAAPSVIETLQQLPRTGWVQWEVPQPETVYDHTVAVRELAVAYQSGLNLSDDELTTLLDMLEIHDWPEALVGDQVILGDEENLTELRATKQQREMAAMEDICASLAEGEYILTLYQRYATGADRVARLAKQIEKFQAVLLAEQYEAQYQKTGLLAEFVYYTKDLITDTFLRSEFQKLAAKVSLWLLYVAVPVQHYSQLLSNAVHLLTATLMIAVT